MKSDIPRQKHIPQVPQAPQPPNTYEYTKTRRRTASSVIIPNNLYPIPFQNLHPENVMAQSFCSRRTPSNTTFSTFISNENRSVPYRTPSEDLQRSNSSRSGDLSQSTGYVALMRKQKATVWCERAQLEDPRLQAQLRAAKLRATKEVTGSLSIHRASTSGSGSVSSGHRVAAKIRHHGYNPAEPVGGVRGVPLRLSATEVEGYDSNEDGESSQAIDKLIHRRNGSGRSSNASSSKGIIYPRQSVTNATLEKWEVLDIPTRQRNISKEESLHIEVKSAHVSLRRTSLGLNRRDGSYSASSGSTIEQADSLSELQNGDALRVSSNNLLKSAMSRKQGSNTPELKRMGSVDDRAISINKVRLYIANPDADSD
ncbi:hypothetical protein Golomagni_03534 [Golovinomyces magnicellulatus]|nr:hypothetical protein Golomagni_03534 [Golovinomyces magnicellulatus]